MPESVTKMLSGAVVGAAVAFAISYFWGFGAPQVVLQAQVSATAESERVTEEELELYIKVYRELQSDRSLKIEDVLVGLPMGIGDFRAIERRVQLQRRLVLRVREALLEQAKENATNLAERGPARN